MDQSKLCQELETMRQKRRRLDNVISRMEHKLVDFEKHKIRKRSVVVSWKTFKELASDPSNWWELEEFDKDKIIRHGCSGKEMCNYYGDSEHKDSLEMFTFDTIDNRFTTTLQVCDVCFDGKYIQYWLNRHGDDYDNTAMFRIDPECLSTSGKNILDTDK